MVPPHALPIVVVGTIFTSVSFMVVLGRLYTRLVLVRIWGPDDIFMVAAMVSALGLLTVTSLQVRYGLGTHFETIPPHELTKFFQTLWATIPTYNLTLLLCKISIIFQYLRIFPTSKIVKICKIMIGVLIVYGCWTVIGSALMCMPVAYFWNPTIKGGHCMNKLAFWFSNAALNIVTDIMILAIPIPVLKQLQLPKKQKVGLMLVFSIGAFVCITSIIRLKSLYEISVSTDTSMDGVNAGVWSLIETNVAIICGSLPAIKPLISRVLPNLLSSAHSQARKTGDDTGLDGTHLKSFGRKSKTASQADGIVVEHSVYQHRQKLDDVEGSEKSLVNVKVDCYGETHETSGSTHESV